MPHDINIKLLRWSEHSGPIVGRMSLLNIYVDFRVLRLKWEGVARSFDAIQISPVNRNESAAEIHHVSVNEWNDERVRALRQWRLAAQRKIKRENLAAWWSGRPIWRERMSLIIAKWNKASALAIDENIFRPETFSRERGFLTIPIERNAVILHRHSIKCAHG